MLVVTFPCFQKLALLDLAHALGLVNETQAPKTFSVPGSSAPFEPLPKDEALIRVFGKLKVLRVAAVAEIEHNYNIDGGIMGRQACQVDSMAYFVRPRVASPGTVLPRPRDPPLFRSLVKLQLDDWLEGSNLPWFMNDEISLTFSRANFPVLESLEVELNKRSDRPLRLAYGRGDRDEDDDDDGDGDGGGNDDGSHNRGGGWRRCWCCRWPRTATGAAGRAAYRRGAGARDARGHAAGAPGSSESGSSRRGRRRRQ